eukprot:1706129-Rhodomonas_salina.8
MLQARFSAAGCWYQAEQAFYAAHYPHLIQYQTITKASAPAHPANRSPRFPRTSFDVGNKAAHQPLLSPGRRINKPLPSTPALPPSADPTRTPGSGASRQRGERGGGAAGGGWLAAGWQRLGQMSPGRARAARGRP